MTGPCLLDTNVISELRRPSPNRGVVEFVAASDLDQLFTSVVNIAELRFGIQMARDAQQIAALELWLANRVRPMFERRILPLSEGVLVRWRLLVERGRKAGITYSQPDLMIAATALEHDLVLVTRNMKDFADLGLSLLDPWTASH